MTRKKSDRRALIDIAIIFLFDSQYTFETTSYTILRRHVSEVIILLESPMQLTLTHIL